MRRKARQRFSRRALGYDRAAVDQYLESVDNTIDELRDARRTQQADTADLVLRATRLSVEALMADAHRRAAEIVDDAMTPPAGVHPTDDVIDIRLAMEAVEPT